MKIEKNTYYHGNKTTKSVNFLLDFLKLSLEVYFFPSYGSVHGFHVFDLLEFLGDFLHSGKSIVIIVVHEILRFVVDLRIVIVIVLTKSAII